MHGYHPTGYQHARLYLGKRYASARKNRVAHGAALEKPGTKMAECYGEPEIWERHRHRYEFNNDFRSDMEEKGLVISGTSPDGRLVETVELPGRAFHLGAQFHPEFKSRPNRAHPLFKGFIAAALQFRAAAQRSMMNV